MALSDTSKINISIKKLAGKAQTSNDKDLANEGLPTGLTLSAETIFGDQIPTSPNDSSHYTVTGEVAEYLRLSASFIPGTDTVSGRHAFALQLPDDYEARSSNPRKGIYPFLNKQVIYITSGSLQLIPTSFSTGYEAKPYHTGSGETAIPVLDARDWNLDYFNGIFFQQDPPATGDSNQNPRYIDAFLYIGSSVKDKSDNNAGGDPNANYLVLSATGSLPNERVFTPGLGLSGTDAGAGGAYTVKIRDSIVATLTGSQFSGNVGITGSFGATQHSVFGKGMEVNAEFGSVGGPGGNDFIHFGSPSTREIIASQASTNQVKILSGGGATSPNESNYQDLAFFVSGSIGSKGTTTKGTAIFGGDVVISGSLFGGPTLKIGDSLAVTGSVESTRGLSGSLTKLIDGTSYLIAGPGIAVTSASNGSVTITNDGTVGDITAVIAGIGLKGGGTSGDVTLDVDDSVVATLTGSQFSGNVGITGSFGATSNSIFGNGSSLSGLDNNFFVSGAIDSRATSTRGTSVFGGDVVVSGTLSVNRGQAGVGSMFTVTSDGKVGIGSDTPAYKLSVGGNMEVGEYIYHKNDANTYIRYQADQIDMAAGGQILLTLREHNQDTVTVGSSGEDVDFQVKTSGNDNTLYVRGDTNNVGIGLNGPSTTLHVKDTNPTVRIQRDANTENGTLEFAGGANNVGASIEHEANGNDLVFNLFNGSSVEESLRLGGYQSAENRQVIVLSGSSVAPSSMQPQQSKDISFFVSGAIGSAGGTTKGTSVFGGDLLTSGTFFAPSGISGSLTRLTDGSSYLVAGNSIVISSASNGSITISAGVSGRLKFIKGITSTIAAGADCDTSANFSAANYSFNRIDIFVNGQLLASGSQNDYLLNTSKTGSIHFNFDLFKDDIVTSIINA